MTHLLLNIDVYDEFMIAQFGLQVHNWVDNWVYGRYIMIYRDISIVIDGFETGHHLVSLVVQGFSGKKHGT